MQTLYSSTFISIVLAFLMFLGYNDQPIITVENPDPIQFTYIFKEEAVEDIEKINIEIFENLTCKTCTEFTQNTLQQMKDLEQETDDINLHLYFIPDISNEVYLQAAMSLKCAADQDQFWNMHAKFHEYKNDLNQKSFTQFAKELEINTEAFQDCMEEKAHLKGVEKDVLYASEKNVVFKPTIFVNENKLIGNQPFENIQKIINDLLKEKREKEKIVDVSSEQKTDLDLEIETPVIDPFDISTPNSEI